ncbi:uncharacterized protein LOC125646390 [Ostrea edulis]|uniref:uncharacterized protein LOC125646390 n=1 Tax=Ostrea edulis TaxID=37623 RepID=UPI00209568B3|nr:uncharacterized protein LOC125646390 [Ostrea edulis]
MESGKRKRGRPSLTESARKKKRKESEKRRSQQRISIGHHLEEWNRLRVALGLQSNPQLAGVLLRQHKHYEGRTRRMSTPAKQGLPTGPEFTVSEISCTDTGSKDSESTETAVSGIEEMEKSFGDQPTSSHVTFQKKALSSSFIDPFSLSISVTKDYDEEEDMHDDDYVPEFDVTLGEENTDIEDVAGGDMVLDIENTDMEVESGENFTGPGITQISSMTESESVLKADKVIAYEEQLLQLASTKINDKCIVKGCSETLKLSTKYVASAMYIVWSCANAHIRHRWCSQPVLNKGLHSGDLMISAAILFSGNNFSKVALMAKFLDLHFPSQSSFTRIQRSYLVPAIDEKWETHQESIRADLGDKNLVLLGDGRMDSPGHCAQYCTYTMMENDSKKIVALETLDKRETGRKSTNLEKAGFQRALEDVKQSNQVTEVVTDAHLQIGALMKRQYPEIKHSHDIWHAAKNLGKKIIAAGQEKSNKDLLAWSQDIVNHFWHCCKVASTYEEFLDVWVGVLHHVHNEHEWALSYGSLAPGSCFHGDLEETERDKKWLDKGSSAHAALTKVVLDKRFLNNVHYFLNFRSTSNLEIFNNHILMYATKRISYSPPVYRARNVLAALDYNHSVDLPTATNKDGSIRYQRTFSKKSGRWTTVERKQNKTYAHIDKLFERALKMRLESDRGMHHPAELSATDPRRISKTIAPKSPPPTAELVSQKKSRFK